MIIRYSEPAKNNKYFIHTSDGGYNWAYRMGSEWMDKPDKWRTVLPNCTGYAKGRFAEIGGDTSCKWLSTRAACCFYEDAKKQGLKTGKTPKIGAVMCWSGGSDGCGHVAIVEQIVDKNTIICSESVYNGVIFRRKERKNDGAWGYKGTSYKFQGFIYNPFINTKAILAFRKAMAAETITLSYDYNGDGKVDMKDLLLLRKSIY